MEPVYPSYVWHPAGGSRYPMGMPTRNCTLVAVLVLLVSWGPLLAQPRPAPKLPEQLLPREVLEKLYAAEVPGYAAGDSEKLYAAHVLLE
jgi:hypothetical protein